MGLRELREAVWDANMALPREGLVRGTSGNASGRDPSTGLVAIKPSGVGFADLTPDDLAVVDLDGQQVEGRLKPSVDTASHLYIYRHRQDVGGVVHTHSPHATAFAVRGQPIGVYTTTAAALFGGPVPVAGPAVIGGEEIGRAVVDEIGQSSALLLRSHGVFTVGPSPAAALRAAVYVEEEAEITHLALLHGDLEPLPEPVVQASRQWYLKDYGQQRAPWRIAHRNS